MSVVIKVENVGKLYQLGMVGTGTLSHDLNRWYAKIRGKEDPFMKLGQTNDRTKKGTSDFVWALKDVNFEVNQGDVLGIVGKNGAGKSTLLKVLSRTTKPTVGEYKVKGRIASLLEVGTGFHPELTGKENIYLNGAILGMSRNEITRKFDEIVDFSGVERYIDTPVKRYSSGMYVRLAFAVAAHLEPEILIVDEVLAVGDLEFQKKCLGKMKDVSGQGRTVLFVSHNMNALRSLCNKGLLMQNGQSVMYGNINQVVDKYMMVGVETIGEKVFDSKDKNSYINDNLRLLSVKLKQSESGNDVMFDLKEKIKFEVNYEVLKEEYSYSIHLYVKNDLGEVVFVSMNNKYSPYSLKPIPKGVYKEMCEFYENFFNEGNYTIDFLITIFPTPQVTSAIILNDVLSFTVTDDLSEKGARGSWNREWPRSIVRPDFKWTLNEC